MEVIENKAIVWDQIWNKSDEINKELIQINLNRTKESTDWISYTKLINDKFGGWENVFSIEIGSGMGWHSFVAASEGAKVTLLDYSDPALKLAKQRFDMFSLEGEFISGNAFEVAVKNSNHYNLSWSFGTAEHFKKDLRQKFFKLHFDFISKNGITIVSCPYKYAINYRLWMYYAVKYNEWSYGLEIPYSKTEFLKRLKKTENSLIKIKFQKGRPCLNKLMNVLRKNSQIRYLIFYPFVKLIQKFNLKISPFNLRSIILIAEKTNE